MQRPASCSQCALGERAQGFSLPDGPAESPIAFWGEALGENEVGPAKPFQGAAGRKLESLLKRLGRPRPLHRFHNAISCRPPKNWLVGAPWYSSAIHNCARHRAPVLAEPHKVHVALGATPARVLLNNPPKFNVQSFHGCPFETEHGIVVPTFHPSFLLQGGSAFTSVFLFDVRRAFEIADKGWTRTPYDAIVDPPADWFAAWLERIPPGTWVFPDIETPGKVAQEEKTETKAESEDDDSGEEQLDFTDQPIVRIGFSVHPDEAVSVPWTEPYVSQVKRFFERQDLQLWWWNWRFDVAVLERHGVVFGSPHWECMDAWGALQSRLPRRVAFVAPFYSDLGPWKHLSATDLGLYNALDCIQQCRVTHGVAKHLMEANRWDVFTRHRHGIDLVLHPGERIGLRVDRPGVYQFSESLGSAADKLQASFRELTDIGKVLVWRKQPKNQPEARLETIEQATRICETCRALDVGVKHRCAPIPCGCPPPPDWPAARPWPCHRTGKRVRHGHTYRPTPSVLPGVYAVERWVHREPFNPDSRLEMLRYLESIDEKPGRNRKTGSASVGKAIIDDIARRRDDKLLVSALAYKAITKVKGTYADGTIRRLDQWARRLGLETYDRLHGQSTHLPWTWRLSMKDPNLQNVVVREEDDEKPEYGFRRVIVPSDDCVLVEADYSGIEAVLSGYFMNDPDYIKLALLGMHSYVLSHKVGKPADRRWPDADLKAYFKELKSKYTVEYDGCKRGVHARNYVGSAYAIQRANPRVFPTIADAEEIVNLYDSLTPKRTAWWKSLWEVANRQNYLDNPFGYRAYFWEIYQWNSRYERMDLGGDAKKAVAFNPQSTAYGILAEAVLELWHPDSPYYVGDLGPGGGTPIRALIHDSILSDVRRAAVERYCERVFAVMSRAIPQLPLPWDPTKNLAIGVAIKIGTKNWQDMEEWRKAA